MSKQPDERIVYVIVASPGGVDGRDMSDKGGPVMAFPTRKDAEAFVRLDSRYEIVPKVVDFSETLRRVMARLSPEERLVVTTLALEEGTRNSTFNPSNR